MLRRFFVRGFCALAFLLIPVVVHGDEKTWTASVDGDFGDPVNWNSGVPGPADAARFNVAGAYTVTFDNSPNPLVNPVLNEDLLFSDGTVTFKSGSGGPYMYHLTGAGSNDAYIFSGSLTLGSSAGPLHLTVDDYLVVRGGGVLNVTSGSQVNATLLFLASLTGDVSGSIAVDSPGAALNAPYAEIGSRGNIGTLTYRNAASGSLDRLFVAASDIAGSAGTLNVESDADVMTGELYVGTGSNSANTGTVNVSGAGSTLTQTGSSPLSIGDLLGVGRVNIGTAANGGTFSTGTGSTTINANGTVTIGSGTNSGIFNANGNMLINGGTLQRQNAGSAFNLAAGKTMTIQNGGRATFAATGFDTAYTTSANANYNVTGGGSRLEATGGFFKINNGAQVTISNAGTLAAGSFLDIGTSGNGILTVDGAASSATALSGFNTWGRNGNSANITFSNGGTGTFSHVYVASDTTPSTTAVVNVLSGAHFNVPFQFEMANEAGPTSSATLNLQGGGSSFTQSETIGDVIVGHATGGTAIINIGTTSSGAIFTGSGVFTINTKGTVNVGSGANTGRLIANGNVTIDGGRLSVGQGSEYSLAANKIMTIKNGGVANITGTYATNDNTVYEILGSGSRLDTGFLQLRLGSQMILNSGGALTNSSFLYVGIVGNGTLTVDGAGTTVTSAIADGNYFGNNGATGTAVFRNNAAGTFSTILLAHDDVAGTGKFTIESGAQVTAGGLQMAVRGGANTSATLTVDGAGSSMTLTPAMQMQIGHASTGSATVNVRNAGSLIVGDLGSTALRATGTINIDGGYVDLKTLIDQGGAINFYAGSLSYIGNLTVGTNGLLGSSLYLGNQHQLTLSGTTTVDAFQILGLYGGSLSTGSLIVNGTFDFASGTLSITGAGGLTIGSGGPFGSAFTLGTGRTLNVTNTATINNGALLVLESGGSFNAGTLANNGTVVLDGIAAVLGGTTVNNNGLLRGEGTVTANVTNGASGEIRAQSGKTITFAGASNTNLGTVNLQGGTAEFSHGLNNGSSGQILGRGTFIAGGTGLANSGHLAFSSGISDVFGNVQNNTGAANRGISVSGNAEVTFWDDVTNAAGSLLRVSSGSSATFFGAFRGAGISGVGDVYFESEISPGSSPASVSFGGDVFLGAGAMLKIELGGLTTGSQYDKVYVAGNLSLDGALDVSLINGFSPGLGNSFEVLRSDAAIIGAFESRSLPLLGPGLDWRVVYSTTAVTLEVASISIPGDYNANGIVDAADYVVWRNGLGTTYTQADYNVWRSQFGQAVSSGAAASGSAAAVPEPSLIWLLFTGALLALARERPRYSHLVPIG